MCLGSCPVYRVTLNRDGTARYEGDAFVSRLGVHAGTVAPDAFDRLAHCAVDRGFFALAERYMATVTDLPAAVTTLRAGGITKRVHNYGGVGPRWLRNFERDVDAVVESIEWTPL